MYVIKIEKGWSAGNSTGYVIRFDDRDDENAEYYAEQWCWNECRGGHNNGFEYDWKYVEDPQEIRSVLLSHKMRLKSKESSIAEEIFAVDKELGLSDKCRLFEVWCDGAYGIESQGPSTYSMGVARVWYDEANNRLHVHLRRPGILIGKAGSTIDELSKYLDCEVRIHEVKTLFY